MTLQYNPNRKNRGKSPSSATKQSKMMGNKRVESIVQSKFIDGCYM